MQEPTTWMGLCRFLGIPRTVGRTIWAALLRAQWSDAVALRQAFVLYEPYRPPVWPGPVVDVFLFDLSRLTSAAATPRQLVKVLEAYIREGVLRRRPEVIQMEEAILQAMTPAGRWKTCAERARPEEKPYGSLV